MAIIAQDTFSVDSDTPLENHTPDIGTGWNNTTFTCEADDDSVRVEGTAIEVASELTDIGSDEMKISLDYTVIRLSSDGRIGVAARIPSGETGESNSEQAYFLGDGTTVGLVLDQVVATVRVNLGTYDADLTQADLPKKITLQALDASTKVLLDDVEVISTATVVLDDNNFGGICGQRGVVRGDNYLSESIDAPAPPAATVTPGQIRKKRLMTGVGL